MWAMTKTGFISVVKDRDSDKLLVRSRRKEDLERTFPSHAAEIVEKPFPADYRWRVAVPREVVAAAVAEAVQAIDYDSHVKEELAGDDDQRYRAYLGCWSALEQMQHNPHNPYTDAWSVL